MKSHLLKYNFLISYKGVIVEEVENQVNSFEPGDRAAVGR